MIHSNENVTRTPAKTKLLKCIVRLLNTIPLYEKITPAQLIDIEQKWAFIEVVGNFISRDFKVLMSIYNSNLIYLSRYLNG